jgi:demethylmenaquinone methyltransferase/2-methoxy-6-polyprenyl-1,4-benzoquinol methylase
MMFDEIAPKYDFLNHLFTLKLDILWRKKIVKNLSLNNFKEKNILDIAAGTGDLTKELLALKPDMIYACDISENMLEVLKNKVKSGNVSIIKADAEHLPFKDETFNIVTIGFGVRNFENPENALNEIYRVLAKNGVLVILDIFKNKSFKAKLFNLYFGKVIPFFGNIISHSSAYTYLFKSVNEFMTANEFSSLLKKHNFKVENVDNNLIGIVSTFYAYKK